MLFEDFSLDITNSIILLTAGMGVLYPGPKR